MNVNEPITTANDPLKTNRRLQTLGLSLRRKVIIYAKPKNIRGIGKYIPTLVL